MKQKLIFLDIDGTLTPAGSNQPPDSAMKAVRAAQAKGHLVFLCTGRNPAMLAPVLALGFDGAVAGAGGYVFTKDEVLFDCPMKKEDFETVYSIFSDDRTAADSVSPEDYIGFDHYQRRGRIPGRDGGRKTPGKRQGHL